MKKVKAMLSGNQYVPKEYTVIFYNDKIQR